MQTKRISRRNIGSPNSINNRLPRLFQEVLRGDRGGGDGDGMGASLQADTRSPLTVEQRRPGLRRRMEKQFVILDPGQEGFGRFPELGRLGNASLRNGL